MREMTPARRLAYALLKPIIKLLFSLIWSTCRVVRVEGEQHVDQVSADHKPFRLPPPATRPGARSTSSPVSTRRAIFTERLGAASSPRHRRPHAEPTGSASRATPCMPEIFRKKFPTKFTPRIEISYPKRKTKEPLILASL